MAEAGDSNLKEAHHLSAHTGSPESLAHQILEIGEAIVLALVAIATAWSGYQAESWTGRHQELYGQASKLRVLAEGTATAANEERFYNASTVVEWLKAEALGEKELADLFERRFLPEFLPAFEAWKKTDPLNSPPCASLSLLLHQDVKRTCTLQAIEHTRHTKKEGRLLKPSLHFVMRIVELLNSREIRD